MKPTTQLALPLVAVAAALLGATPASAATQTYHCNFGGEARNITPPIAPAPTTGGSGTFEFVGSATCSYVFAAADRAARTTVVPATGIMRSTGDYENDICSTGRWFGHTHTRALNDLNGPGTTINPGGGIPPITQLDYAINFVGFQGELRGGNLVNKRGVTPATPGTLNNQDGWRVTGVVSIQPAGLTGCSLTAVEEFEVAGEFTAVRP